MNSSNKGFVLIEAIIALIVSAVGLLGIGLFSSDLISESANTKAQTEAMVIAQREMESLRRFAGQNELASIALVPWPTVSSSLGTNFTYQVSGSINSDSGSPCAATDKKCIASIQVVWDNNKSVNLTTILVADMFDATAVNGSATGTVAENNPYVVNPPSGDAKYGEDAQGGVLPAGITLASLAVSSATDSTSVRLLGEVVSGAEIVTKELLTYGGTAFAEVRGVVYVDFASTRLSESDYASIVVRPSDTGVCPKGPPNPLESSDDWFFEYRCFFGGGWYGNIQVSVISGTSFESDKTQCVGDPTIATDDGTLVSRHAQIALDARRAYRGYSIAYSEDGPIFDGSGNLVLVTHGLEAGDVYGYGTIAATVSAGQNLIVGDGQHDFILVSNQGGGAVSTDSECLTTLSNASNPDAYESYIPGYIGSSTTVFDNFVGNAGDYVCLEVNGTSSCPGIDGSIDSEEASAALISITGTVSSADGFQDGYSRELFSVTSQFPSGFFTTCVRLQDGTCDPVQTQNVQVCTNDGLTYTCKIYVPVTGSWSGSITHEVSASDESYTVCSPSNGVDLVYPPISSDASGAVVNITTTSSCLNATVDYTVSITNTTNSDFDLSDYTEYIVIDGDEYQCSPGSSELLEDRSGSNPNYVYDTVSFSCNGLPDGVVSEVLLDGSPSKTINGSDLDVSGSPLIEGTL